jgi:hypothetical protein
MKKILVVIVACALVLTTSFSMANDKTTVYVPEVKSTTATVEKKGIHWGWWVLGVVVAGAIIGLAAGGGGGGGGSSTPSSTPSSPGTVSVPY